MTKGALRGVVSGLAMCFVIGSSPMSIAAEKGHKDDSHKHSEKEHKPHHGGVVSTVGHHEFELVAKPDALTLHVSMDEKPVATKGGTASITLLLGADKSLVKLEPTGENRFEAKGTFKVAAGTKVLATVVLPGKKSEQVRFTLK